MTPRRRRPVVELEERGVFGADQVMAKVALALRAALREARVNGSSLDPDLAAYISAVQAAEQRFHARPVPGGERRVAAAGSAGSSSSAGDVSLTSDDVARMAGLSRRAVTKAAARGRLSGRLVAGRWVFTSEAARRWAAGRGAHEDGDDEPRGPVGRGRADAEGRDG